MCSWLANRSRRSAWVAAWLALTLLTAETTLPAAPSVTNITVRNVAGVSVQPCADVGQKATLLFFLMHDCPVANSYAPEINRIVADYSPRQIRCFVVYVEDDLMVAAARQHVEDYGFQCGALLDPEHLLVAQVGATVSPEAALVSAAGQVLYRGRIDDRAAGLGKNRVQATRRDLRLSLEAFTAGKPIPTRLTKAIGCYIPDRRTTKPTRPPNVP